MLSRHHRPRAMFARGLLITALAGLLSPLALAGGFQVSPTKAQVPAGTRVASFELRNNSDVAVSIQVDLLAWSQDAAGGDTLLPATDAIAVPRMATLLPNGRQLVRVAVQGKAANEAAYRLRLREVPPPPPPGFMGVRTLVEQLVPVFFLASGAPEVIWQAKLQPAGLMLSARNSGGRHLAVSTMEVLDERGAVLAQRKGPGYVLAGQATNWSLPAAVRPAPGNSLRLQFVSNGTSRTVPLTLE